MASMAAYPPPAPTAPTSGSVASSKAASMAYAVNGISLSSPSVDLIHPAMNYQGKNILY